MKKQFAAFIVFCLASNICSAVGLWRFTEAVDSQWAGTVQLKWDSATGVSFHSNGYGGSQATWANVLTHITWTAISCPNPQASGCGWKSGPATDGRYDIRPHVVFGRADTESNRRTAVFMIDSYTGAAYVAAEYDPNMQAENFLYHDVISNAYWLPIDEAVDLTVPPISKVGRYELSAVNSTYPLPLEGQLGPFVTRLDRVTGRVDVAIPKYLFVSGSSVAKFVWCQISNTDPGPNPSAPGCPHP